MGVIKRVNQMLPLTLGIIIIIIIIVNDDGVDVGVVVGLVFPKPCPSLCQVSMGWWTEDQLYSVCCWTQNHWHSLVTVTLLDVPRSSARHIQKSLYSLLHSVSCKGIFNSTEMIVNVTAFLQWET